MPTKHTTAYYTCDICQERYNTKQEAKKCEQMPIEKQSFKVGEQVQAPLECFSCSECHDVFKPMGKITKVTLSGNGKLTHDYVNRFLYDTSALDLLGKMHLYNYLVKYACNKCGKAKENVFYTVELKHCRKTKKKVA